MAANKSDLYDDEKVSEENARKFAKEIGAIFKLTSACTSTGIEELFVGVGSKYLDPNYVDDENKKPKVKAVDENINPSSEEQQQPQSQPKTGKADGTINKNLRSQSIKLSPQPVEQKNKKKCC